MKYKQIILFFCVALPVSLGLRLMQLFFIVEANTGFFKHEYDSWGNGITAIIIAVGVITAVFSFFSHRSPENPPKTGLVMGISSVLLAFAVAMELFFTNGSYGVSVVIKILLYLFGILFVLWLIVFSVKDFLNIKIPLLTYAIPCLYFVARLIYSFGEISSLALISDNIFLIAAYCAVLLFMLNFAKLYNNFDKEKGFRKLLASGLASVLFCFTQSVPNVVFHILSGGYSHTAVQTNFSMFFTGVFIAVFVFSHFSYANACK